MADRTEQHIAEIVKEPAVAKAMAWQVIDEGRDQ